MRLSFSSRRTFSASTGLLCSLPSFPGSQIKAEFQTSSACRPLATGLASGQITQAPPHSNSSSSRSGLASDRKSTRCKQPPGARARPAALTAAGRDRTAGAPLPRLRTPAVTQHVLPTGVVSMWGSASGWAWHLKHPKRLLSKGTEQGAEL
uniref:Uncharacterized protein n=1 Tax=Myotis myotis TaxID=51298 RepID=A0A7J7U5Q3_MYOMY|nr:hypothetical protein mMyoMyo1_008911 [Myotis myotis]